MGLSTLHFDHGIFPDGHFGVIGPSRCTKVLDDLAGEVAQACRSIAPFVANQVFTVHRAQSSWLGDAEQFGYQEVKMAKELLVIGSVAHIFKGIAVDVQTAERWTEDAEMNALRRQGMRDGHTIPMRELPAIAARPGKGLMRLEVQLFLKCEPGHAGIHGIAHLGMCLYFAF